MRDFLKEKDVQVVAVCDVHQLHYRDHEWGKGEPLGRDAARKTVEDHYAKVQGTEKFSGCAALNDFRELCARKDIDAVLIATPDHWHAFNTLEALHQGKDVYCEKPVTHLFAEGQTVCRAAAEHKAVVQVGSQQRSDARFRRAVEIVRNGHLGAIQRIEVGLPPGYNKPMGSTALSPIPEHLDYDLWCGPAPKLPYMAARHHRWWRGHRAFGGGNLMDWIGHHNDIAHWGIAMEQSGPTRVEAVAWTMPATDIYNTPAHYEIHSEYPGNIQSVISSDFELGTKWIGEKGWLFVTRGKTKASDPRWEAADFDAGPWKGFVSPGHVRNFLNGVKKRQPCIAPPEIAHRSVTPGHLAYVSYAVGRPLRWNPKEEKIIADDEAQTKLMALSYRSPWTLKS